jgi:hypothetical protein
MAKEGDLQVWWSNNFGQQKFEVENIEQAKGALKALGHSEVRDDRIIWNAGGLEIYENGEWCEWYSEDGLDIKEIMNEEEEE